jgi:Tfp pilus assembly protein PilF
MYRLYVAVLMCLATMAGLASDTIPAIRPEVNEALDKAIELEHQGQVQAAERILLDVIQSAQSGGVVLELGVALNNLAVLYLATDRYSDAERQFKRSTKVLETLEGETAEQVLAKTRLHLGALYIETGRGREATKLDLPSLLAILRSPEDKMRVRSAMAGLAMLRKELDSAEQNYLEVLAFWQEPARAAASRTEIATVLNNLGVIALWQRQPAVAQTRLDESFAVWQSILGPESPMLAKAMTNVATVCMQLRQYDEAAKWLGRAEAIAQGAFGELHSFTVGTQVAYAEALKKAGRQEEARQVSRSASEARKSMRSPSIADYTVDYRDLRSDRIETKPR